MSETPQMYVRYIGDKVCWTLPSEHYYIGDLAELTDAERTICDGGGGYMPVSDEIAICASETGRAHNGSLQDFIQSAPPTKLSCPWIY